MKKLLTKRPKMLGIMRKSIAFWVLHFLFFSSYYVGAQYLPDTFFTKVEYGKVTTVSYEMTSQADDTCLTLRELSQYHGYMQLTNHIEIIDLDGEILTETEYVLESNVRDDWMEGYHKVVVGKDSLYAIGLDLSVLNVSPRESEETILLTEEQASYYEYYKFDEVYTVNLIQFLTDSNIAYTNEFGIVTMFNDGITVVYDHNTKITVAIEYDSVGVKTKETTYEYHHKGGDEYVPLNETIVEWITTDRECCVRKTTSIQYLNFERVVITPPPLLQIENESTTYRQNEETVVNHGIEVSTVSGSNQFMVKVENEDKNVEYEVFVYDITGKRLSAKTITGTATIDLPTIDRAGVFIVHIYDKKSNTFILGKAVLASAP